MSDGVGIGVAVRERAQLGEGPRWIDDQLLWVDIPDGALHRFDPRTGVDAAVRVDDVLGMVAPRRGGGLVLAVGRAVVLSDPTSREVARIELPEPPGNRVNDGRCDAVGRLWIGTMSADGDGRAGSLYRVDPDGTVRRWEGEVGISNGLDWSPDGRRMYYIDTSTHRVDVYDYDVDDGVARDRRPLVVFPDHLGSPDGLTVDAEGGLWIAFHGGWALRRYTPAGVLDREIALPVAQPTACAFGGRDLDDLYVTTAREGLDGTALGEQPLAGSVLRLRPGVTGRVEHAFAG
jgi:sugar lactone lactonase YvrE